MADVFFNDQLVTANDLNQIAVDLGAADYTHFPETPPQSAVSALNQITSDLTTAGILQIGNQCAVGDSADNTTSCLNIPALSAEVRYVHTGGSTSVPLSSLVF